MDSCKVLSGISLVLVVLILVCCLVIRPARRRHIFDDRRQYPQETTACVMIRPPRVVSGSRIALPGPSRCFDCDMDLLGREQNIANDQHFLTREITVNREGGPNAKLGYMGD